MSPVAAYYIFIANENERRNAPRSASIRPARPSLIERARRLADGLRSASRLAPSA